LRGNPTSRYKKASEDKRRFYQTFLCVLLLVFSTV
jgi:hypothetical protein